MSSETPRPSASSRMARVRPPAADPEGRVPSLLNVGYGNLVAAGRVVAVVNAQSAPMRRLRDEAAARGKLIDATQGRRTRSIVVVDSDHVVLSAINPETLAARLAPHDEGGA